MGRNIIAQQAYRISLQSGGSNDCSQNQTQNMLVRIYADQ